MSTALIQQFIEAAEGILSNAVDAAKATPKDAQQIAKLRRHDANVVNRLYKVAWDAVFSHADALPEFDGDDVGKLASAAAMAVQDKAVELLTAETSYKDTHPQLWLNIRNFLYPMTVSQMREEHRLSLERGDTVRAGLIQEYIEEAKADEVSA